MNVIDLEEANKRLIAKVANHRNQLKKVAKMKNVDVYDKHSRCRFCGYTCTKRKLHEHDPFCIYSIAHHVPKTNKDLKDLTHRRIHIQIKRVKGTPTWMERVVLFLIDLLETFDHNRTIKSFIAYLELNSYIVYRWEGKR